MNDWKEKIAFKGDKILWYIVIMLMIASVMVVYSSTGRLAYNEKAGNTFFYLIKQLFLIGGCFGVMFIVQSIHYRYFYKYAGVLLFVSMILLVCAAFGGTNINGAGRWIRLPLIGLTFQPSELAKIAIMMFTARILSEAQTDTHCDDSVLQKFLLFVGPVILLIFMDNFSTSALIGAVCFILFMIARMRWRLLAMTLGTALAAIALVLILGIYIPQVQKWGRIGTMVNRITDFAKGGEDGVAELFGGGFAHAAGHTDHQRAEQRAVVGCHTDHGKVAGFTDDKVILRHALHGMVGDHILGPGLVRLGGIVVAVHTLAGEADKNAARLHLAGVRYNGGDGHRAGQC